MKKYILIISSLLTLASCTVSEEPTFEKIQNIKVIKVSTFEVVVNADLVFFNPNDVGCELINTDINAYANEHKIGYIKQGSISQLKSKKEFKIPIALTFKPSEVIKDKVSILEGLLNGLKSKSINILFKGHVSIKKAGLVFMIDVESEEEIKLKKDV